MKRRYWAPILAVAAAIMILVPTTLAIGEPGTALYATFQSNRFPGGGTTATGQLSFLNDGQIRLDVTVTGNDIRDWTVRVYRGNCAAVAGWLVNRDSNGLAHDGTGYLPRIRTNSTLSMLLFSGDAARVQAALGHHPPFPIALMLAGAGSGGLVSGSAYRTCTRFQTFQTPVTHTTTSTTGSNTSTTRTTTTSLTTSSSTNTSNTSNTTTSSSTNTSNTSNTTSSNTSNTSNTTTGASTTTGSSTNSSALTTGTFTTTVPTTVTSLTTINLTSTTVTTGTTFTTNTTVTFTLP